MLLAILRVAVTIHRSLAHSGKTRFRAEGFEGNRPALMRCRRTAAVMSMTGLRDFLSIQVTCRRFLGYWTSDFSACIAILRCALGAGKALDHTSAALQCKSVYWLLRLPQWFTGNIAIEDTPPRTQGSAPALNPAADFLRGLSQALPDKISVSGVCLGPQHEKVLLCRRTCLGKFPPMRWRTEGGIFDE
jgi:hypothetical protein